MIPTHAEMRARHAILHVPTRCQHADQRSDDGIHAPVRSDEVEPHTTSAQASPAVTCGATR